MRNAVAFSMLLLTVTVGCRTTRPVILDPTLPHDIAERCECQVWVKSPEGGWVKQKAELRAGDVCQDGGVLRERIRQLEAGEKRP